MVDVTPEKALIFRITHIDNVPRILDNGLCCRNAAQTHPQFRQIGNPELIAKRDGRDVPIPPNGTLSDYTPFYFTPLSPMLLNIKTGYGGIAMLPMRDIAILVTSLGKIASHAIRFVFTDRHAYLNAARFSSNLKDLDRIDWKILRNRDFKRDPNDPAKVERYQAEALIHAALPTSALLGIACYDASREKEIRQESDRRSIPIKVVVKPGWYF